MNPERYRLKVTGIVQGIGFRPFVYNLAASLLLKGRVLNTGDGVEIEIEGPRDRLDAFVNRLKSDAPPLALIRSIALDRLPLIGYDDFQIKTSQTGGTLNTLISPDISICEDCSRELFDPADSRYGYPFINCTNCGPRFTIIKDIPYDRPNTTMSSFEMCGQCRSQYEDPADRRYHAQPVSCGKCGPELHLLDNRGALAACGDAPERARKLLEAGHILAVKGLGGYHLACDAKNKTAVAELRRRKQRDEKPFALMAKDMDTVRKYCRVDAAERALLESVRKPVVLLKKREDCSLPQEIAPGNPYLGIMLPYTPVHLLLFNAGETAASDIIDMPGPEILVMTSGNISSEPICYKDDDALRELKGIADFYLTNNREIFIRTDDSVTRSFQGNEYIIRRARGYVPMPVICEAVPADVPSVLACGGELKNAFCLGKGREFYVSHHIGDLENLETMQSFEEGVEHFKRLFGIKPEIIAYDLHPEYLSTKYAMEATYGRKVGVQHHKAHIASCMADNDVKGEVIGVAFDGTGYGEDGKIWGGEFFTGSYGSLRRAAHLEYVRMPGGSAAIHEPWRMACSYLENAGIDSEVLAELKGYGARDLWHNRKAPEERKASIGAVKSMIAAGFNSPFTSGMGRLFDAVSAIAGVRYSSGFEGQAAMELEFAAGQGGYGRYPFEIYQENGVYVLGTPELVKSVFRDRQQGVSAGIISTRFHETVAVMIHEICCRLRKETGMNRVVLSGGVFQNMLLLSRSAEMLAQSGLEVFVHKRVPANDGGLSLGQAVIAVAEDSKF